MEYQTIVDLREKMKVAKQKADEAYSKKQDADAVYYSQKYCNLRKATKRVPQYYPEHLLLAGVGCVAGMAVGLMAYGMCMDSLLQAYLLRPENELMLQEMMSESGADSLQGLINYLTSYDPAGQEMLSESGAKSFLSRYAMGMGVTSVVAGAVLSNFPFVRARIGAWKCARVTKEKEQCDAEFSKLNGEYKAIVRQIKDATSEYYEEALRNSKNKGLGERNLPVVYYYGANRQDEPSPKVATLQKSAFAPKSEGLNQSEQAQPEVSSETQIPAQTPTQSEKSSNAETEKQAEQSQEQQSR